MPKEEQFHVLFDRDTAHLLSGARLFVEVVNATSFAERKAKVVQLTALEKEGDRIAREIFEALNSTFISPLDREDIRSMASDLDDILDFFEGVGQYLVAFELSDSPE